MKRLLIGLAVASLFSGAGIAVSCDLGQNDASNDGAPMASKAVPVVTASKQATTKGAGKAAKAAVIACDGAGCNSVAPNASVAKPAVVACQGAGCP
jgi:hypothetical protein